MTNIQFIFYFIGIITSIAIVGITCLYFLIKGMNYAINHSVDMKDSHRKENKLEKEYNSYYKTPHMRLTLKDGAYLGWCNCENQTDFENNYRGAKFQYPTVVYMNDTCKRFLYMPDTDTYYEFVNFGEFDRWKDLK
nr:MAG TPA: hypothetical protein [Caudoviricetes sp.]